MTDTVRAKLPTAVFALAAINVAVGTQGFAFAGLVPEMARDLAVSVGQTGWLIAANAMVYAIGAPIAASLTRHLERRRIMLLALAALCLVNLSCAIAPSFGPLLGLRVMAGAVNAVLGALATIAAAQLVAPQLRGRAFAVVMSGVTIAFLVGVPLGSAIGGIYGWRASFLFAALIAVLAAVLVGGSVPKLNGDTAVGRPSRAALLNPGVWIPLAVTFLSFAATFTVVAFIGPVARHAVGAEGAGIGMLQMFIGLGSIIGLALGARSAERGRAIAVSRLALVVMATNLAGYKFMLDAPPGATHVAMLALTILSGAAALFTLIPINLSRLAANAGTAAPIALALNGSLISLGQGVGALLGGALTDSSGAGMMAVAASAVAVLALTLVMGPRNPP